MVLAYLDNNATTPIAPEVTAVMQPYFHELFGNPSSTHVKGVELGDVIEQARCHVANLLNAKANEVTFTSGGSESNNHVLKGVFLKRKQFLDGHLVISCFFWEQRRRANARRSWANRLTGGARGRTTGTNVS